MQPELPRQYLEPADSGVTDTKVRVNFHADGELKRLTIDTTVLNYDRDPRRKLFSHAGTDITLAKLSGSSAAKLAEDLVAAAGKITEWNDERRTV